MYISQFTIYNFKSFYNRASIALSPGFNLITGQNSAGKTALLEAMTLRFANKPHRSLRTSPKPGTPVEEASTADVAIELNADEVKDLLMGPSIVMVPFPDVGEMQRIAKTNNQDNQAAISVLNWLFDSSREFSFRLKFYGSGGITANRLPSYGLYRPQVDQGGGLGIRFRVEQDRKVTFHELVRTNPPEDAGIIVGSRFRDRIYRFSAERFNIGVSEYGNSRILTSNASNLPAVLNLMNENPRRVEEFNEILHSILPQVTQYSMRSVSNLQTEILIWSIDPRTKRADLAIPLNECGTGIGQVLAILYVTINSDLPQTILIDEPQSFLHPGAARKLIEVLKRYSHHQFVIATHSPTVITAASPSTVTVLKMEDGETVPCQVDVTQREAAELYLNEIGARLSDVFGADDVLWVEGRTEEICAPKILESFAEWPTLGTVIVGIRKGISPAVMRKKCLRYTPRLLAVPVYFRRRLVSYLILKRTDGRSVRT